MLTGLHHVELAVTDLARTVEECLRLGFHVTACAPSPAGVRRALIRHGGQHLELSESQDITPGIRAVAVVSDDLGADLMRLRAGGLSVGEPHAEERVTAEGEALRWRAVDAPVAGLTLRLVDAPGAIEDQAAHPGGARDLDSIYVAAPDLTDATATYRNLLPGVTPRPLRGIVIKARMTMFDLGDAQLALAEPDGPGATADALAARGAGAFQVIYRTEDVRATQRWLATHGVAATTMRRSTGEQTVVVPASEALGCAFGFVGVED